MYRYDIDIDVMLVLKGSPSLYNFTLKSRNVRHAETIR